MELSCAHPWLVAELGSPHDVASWAIVRGGLCTARRVAWLHVDDVDLDVKTDPVELLQRRLQDAGLHDAVGLLTACTLAHHQHLRRVVEGPGAGPVGVDAVATVGLHNRLAVGDPPTPAAVGTINLLARIDRPVSPTALLEAMSIAVEARTAAVLGLGLPSPVSGAPSTGTGTDCVVVAAPTTGPPPLAYAGKHTALGAALGQAVFDAVSEGGRRWVARNHR